MRSESRMEGTLVNTGWRTQGLHRPPPCSNNVGRDIQDCYKVLLHLYVQWIKIDILVLWPSMNYLDNVPKLKKHQPLPPSTDYHTVNCSRERSDSRLLLLSPRCWMLPHLWTLRHSAMNSNVWLCRLTSLSADTTLTHHQMMRGGILQKKKH